MTVVAWVGDSITAGVGASNAGKAWPAQVLKILGARISASSVNAGVAGDESADLLARIGDVLTVEPGLVVLMVGTNDAAHAVPVADFRANVEAIAAAVNAAGARLAVALLPPRATDIPLGYAYNLWLRAWCHRRGVPCVDTFAALVDPATGLLAAAYDSGDGVHPNDAGHLKIAEAVAAVLESLLPLPVWHTGGGIVSGPWTHTAGPTGALSTVDGYTRISATSGLPTYSLPITAPAVGDKLLLQMDLRGSSAAAINKVEPQGGSSPIGPILASGFPTAEPGWLVRAFVVPAYTGTYRIGLNVDARSGAAWVDVIADVWNLTAMGLEDLEV